MLYNKLSTFLKTQKVREYKETYLYIKIETKQSCFPKFLLSEYINIKAEEVMEVILSGDDIPPSSAAAKTSDNVSDITAKSYEDIINVNEQKTNSSMSVTKEYEETGTRSLIEENRQLKDLRMCKICMEKDASIAMLPCGHLCCCTDCAPAMRKCPICRQFVKGTVRTWLA